MQSQWLVRVSLSLLLCVSGVGTHKIGNLTGFFLEIQMMSILSSNLEATLIMSPGGLQPMPTS